MAITINIFYTGKNDNAKKFAEEMIASGTVDLIRKEKGNLKYEYFVPFDDKNRAKQLLEDNNFIDISKRFEYLYWEGSGDFRRGDILTRIDEIEDDVRRKSPFQISNLERGIQSILIQASLDSNAKLKEKGLELLEKLRKNEDELYREYVGKWLLAKATDDTQLKQKIRNVSEGVFSLETDRRRNLILQDIWEYDK